MPRHGGSGDPGQPGGYFAYYGSWEPPPRDVGLTVPDDQRLMRFLVLGTEWGAFYSTQAELRQEQLVCVTNLIRDGQGETVVEKVKEVVKDGRAIRMEAALLALAVCCRSTDAKTKSAAYRAILEVCNIPTHLFMLVGLLEKQGKTTGWGRGMRNAVSRWYNQFANNPRRLAMLVTKYKQRGGWSHRDLLRLCHLRPCNDAVGFVLRYAVKGLEQAKQYYVKDGYLDDHSGHLKQMVTYLQAVEEVSKLEATTQAVQSGVEGLDVAAESMEVDDSAVQRAVELIQEFDLLREHLPTSMLNCQPIWQALLHKMPLMALMRNLNKMTIVGLLDVKENLDKVLENLANKEALKQAKVHPYSILLAWYTYKRGMAVKGKTEWTPIQAIVNALEAAFYASFSNVQPTNKRILMALDVSLSMAQCERGSVVPPRDAALAMALVTLNVEKNADLVAFSYDLSPMDIKKDWTLDQAIEYSNSGAFPPGYTDCSKPMQWALRHKKEYDAFIVYTDCETWSVDVTPAARLYTYRSEMSIPKARLAVVAMTSRDFTLADPADLYMMDVVGFDPQTPAALHSFVAGNIYE